MYLPTKPKKGGRPVKLNSTIANATASQGLRWPRPEKAESSPVPCSRITIPAMGPAPIALDFAFPAVNEGGDEIENFSFFVGFLR